MASQSLISAVNSYDNYIQRKGIDEQVIDAYIQALSVAFRSENDVKYGLQQSAKTKSLIAKYVREKTGGRVADLEVYAGDNDTSYKILDQFYNVLMYESGGWAKVFIKGRETPEYQSVSFDEYVGRKKDGTINSQWSKKPATMIRKVAVVQALREAFPDKFQGLYAQEEFPDVSDVKLDVEKVVAEEVQANANTIEFPDATFEEVPQTAETDIASAETPDCFK